MKKYIPNIITIIRLILLPVFIYFMLKEEYLVSAFIFIGAGFSDLLDGYLARKWNVVSNFGKLADPFADKALHISAIILLCILGKLHITFAYILAVKEIMMIGGGLLLLRKKVVVYAMWFGKVAALIMNATIVFILVFMPAFLVSNILMGVAMLLEIIALSLYTKRYFDLKKEAEQKLNK